MRPDDFFIEQEPLMPDTGRRLDMATLVRLRAGPLSDHDDAEVAVALARLIHDDLEDFGTGGEGELNNEQMRQALVTLRAVANRLEVPYDLPFRDFTTWRTWWIRQGAAGAGGYQKRRNLLSDVFDPLHDQLADLEARALRSTLVEPVSPHARTGWPGVDAEITELRRHFRSATTEQDYRNVGNDCVAVTEALSRQVYDHTVHGELGEGEPPVDNSKNRIGRFVDKAAPGADNAKIRKVAVAVIELSHSVKHRSAPTRLIAGIAADSVIQLASLLRRLDQDN
jgi:hypothetical protein